MPAGNIEQMAYRHEGAVDVPWHGFGNPVPPNATIDEMRAAAALTWDPVLIEQRHRFVLPTDPTVDVKQAIADVVKDLATKQIGKATAQERIEALLGELSPTRLLVRSDTRDILTKIPGKKYQAMSNEWVFEFFRAYCEIGSLTMETAGALDGGKYVWCLARVNRSFKLGDDKVDEYVLLYNPNIYGKGARVKMTLVRVVCQNTLTMALSDSDKNVQLWHAKPFDEERRKEVQADLAALDSRFTLLHEAAEALSEHKLDVPDARLLTLGIIEPKVEQPALIETAEGWEENASRNAKRVMKLYQGEGHGSDLPSANGTAWGLLNAVTEFVDHVRGDSGETRLVVSWFTYGEITKQLAMERLLIEAGQPDLATALSLDRVERVAVR